MVTVVVQAGGESRRMGQDKALVPFLGRPLIQRVLERVTLAADELMVTTNKPEDYLFLGLPLVSDRMPGRGALGGLYTALSAAQHNLVGVVACDMPFASGQLLKVMASILENPDYDAVIPVTDQGKEPFHAMYRRETCLPAVEAALQAGRWRADAWYPDVRLRLLTLKEIHPYNPDGLVFWNVNTPDELKRAEEIANQSS